MRMFKNITTFRLYVLKPYIIRNNITNDQFRKFHSKTKTKQKKIDQKLNNLFYDRKKFIKVNYKHLAYEGNKTYFLMLNYI